MPFYYLLHCQRHMTFPFTFSFGMLGSFRSRRRSPNSKLSFFRLLEVLTIGLINLLLQAHINSTPFPSDFRRIRLSFKSSPTLILVGHHESTFRSSSLGAVYPLDLKSSTKCLTSFHVLHFLSEYVLTTAERWLDKRENIARVTISRVNRFSLGLSNVVIEILWRELRVVRVYRESREFLLGV